MSKTILILLGLLLCAPITQAQQTSAPADSLELDQIVITASKIPLSLRETTKPVILIDRREIEQSGSRNLGQLLNQQSGIRVNDAFGSPANPQILYLQGAAPSNTLILINGLAINDPSGTGGTYDLRSIPLSNVEQIEILKGSQSTLFGSDAIAGVVNIITRQPGTSPVQATGEFAYGSFNSLQASGGLRGSLNERVSYVMNYKRESSDGFSAAVDPTGSDSFGRDGFASDAFFVRTDLAVTDGLVVSPFFHYSGFDGDFDGGAFTDAENEFSLQKMSPGAQLSYHSDRVQLRGGFNHVRTDRSFLSQFGLDEFEGRFNNADLYTVYSLFGPVQLLAGLNYQHSLLPGSDETERFSSTITSPYATLFIKNPDGLSAEAGIRFNTHSEYGSNTTFSLAPSYQITGSLKLFGSLTSGFKAPTLSELFGPFGANPDLQPQTSRYLSGGAEMLMRNQSLRFTAQIYQREIDDLIIYSFESGFINRDRQNDSGFELSGNWIANHRVRAGAHYNYVTGEITTDDAQGNRIRQDNLIRRPAHSIGANLQLRLSDRLDLRIDGEYNSDRSDLFFDMSTFTQQEVSLEAYTLINLYAGYTLFDGRTTLFLDIRNLLNSEFTEIYGYNTAGLNAKAGFRLGL
ncbi:MAG: TonB-dependent receptor [Balneolaceae bacterium]|nr:MAG: TonB-dependent receptor [Balneolaceae bacterium]